MHTCKKEIQPVEKTTFRFKTFSARRNNVAKKCFIMYSSTRQNDRTNWEDNVPN